MTTLPESHLPGAGAVAAETVALAAALCEALARAEAASWSDARGATTQAAHLLQRTGAARDANRRAYAEARRQLAIPIGSTSGRDGMLAAALRASADTLLSIAAVAADTAALAAEMAGHLRPEVRPDALGAAEIAAGAAAATTELVGVNLALGPEDPRRERAAQLLAEARASVARARSAQLC